MADGTLSQDKVKARLRKLHTERERLEEEKTHTGAQLMVGAGYLTEAIDLLRNVRQLYERASAQSRRELNQTFFRRFYLNEVGVAWSDRNAPFDDITDAYATYQDKLKRPDPGIGALAQGTSVRLCSHESPPSLRDLFKVTGSTKGLMVEVVRRYSKLEQHLKQIQKARDLVATGRSRPIEQAVERRISQSVSTLPTRRPGRDGCSLRG